MKNIDDLITSAMSLHNRYNAGRTERETVREWVLGLGGYPPPYAAAITSAGLWFRATKSDMPLDELKIRDLDCLRAIANPGGSISSGGATLL